MNRLSTVCQPCRQTGTGFRRIFTAARPCQERSVPLNFNEIAATYYPWGKAPYWRAACKSTRASEIGPLESALKENYYAT